MISVCIATYNGERFIKEQLQSILPQLAPDDEIIISDDSSTDNTIKIIRGVNDRRIKIFLDQKFKNPIFNFENALVNASGDLIFLSDQDDIWLPNKLKVMSEKLKEFDMAVSDCQFINDKGEIVLDSYFEKVQSGTGVLKNLKKNTYLGCCMAFKKTLLSKALPFPKDIPMHDIWLGFVADLFYRPIFIEQKLLSYRKHDQNASITSDIISNNTIMKKLKFRFNILKYLPKVIFR